jgi:hypothetical protein
MTTQNARKLEHFLLALFTGLRLLGAGYAGRGGDGFDCLANAARYLR